MNIEELKILAQKYLDGTATSQEKALLDQWYETVHNGETELVETKNRETKEQVRDRIFNQLKEKVVFESSGETVPVKKNKLIRLFAGILSAAAVFAVVLFIWNQNTDFLKTKQLVAVPVKKIIHIVLPDGSKVWLNAGSVFKYPKKFNAEVRTVELIEGHAFFEIQHENKHPFVVKTKTLNVTVLGTAFDVRAYKNETTTKVSVVTGKVGVTRRDVPEQPAVMLLPKQQVVLSKVNHQIFKEATPEIAINVWCKSKLVFEQEELGNVFKVVEKKYNIKIHSDDRKLLKERISITLNDQPLDNIMTILSFTKHFKYKIANDSTIVTR